MGKRTKERDAHGHGAWMRPCGAVLWPVERVGVWRVSGAEWCSETRARSMSCGLGQGRQRMRDSQAVTASDVQDISQPMTHSETLFGKAHLSSVIIVQGRKV